MLPVFVLCKKTLNVEDRCHCHRLVSAINLVFCMLQSDLLCVTVSLARAICSAFQEGLHTFTVSTSAPTCTLQQLRTGHSSFWQSVHKGVHCSGQVQPQSAGDGIWRYGTVVLAQTCPPCKTALLICCRRAALVGERDDI